MGRNVHLYTNWVNALATGVALLFSVIACSVQGEPMWNTIHFSRNSKDQIELNRGNWVTSGVRCCVNQCIREGDLLKYSQAIEPNIWSNEST
jgi:hypothetical protein